MKPEQKFWRDKVQPVMATIPGLKYERVELSTGKCGMPDVYYTCGRSGWIELKWVKLKPNKLCDIVESIDLSGWKREQRRWAKDHGQLGAPVFLLVGSENNIFLIDALPIVDDPEISIFSKHILAMWVGGSKINGAELKSILKSRGNKP